jgi:mycothiol system anti-sigma-R factor
MIAALLAVVTGLIANECFQLAPWCARKLARWSAFQKYTDHDRAVARAEEWAAVVNERPGNLLKLFTACGFACGAVLAESQRKLAREERQALTAVAPGHIHGVACAEVLARVYSYLDGEIRDTDLAQVRQHLDECGPCLREYGLEEAVNRLVRNCCGAEAPRTGLEAKVLIRIRKLRDELQTGSSTPTTRNNPRFPDGTRR